MLDLGRALKRRVSRSFSRKTSLRRVMSKKNPVSAAAEPSAGVSEMDMERRRRNIRLYVYRLYEVRNWLAECLGGESVPEPIELEEALRSGVLLAKLANYFAPELVAKDKIFDIDESRLKEEGFHYRHTDNINLWRRACLSVRIKDIVLPDPVDVYAGRNTRTVLALVTLANQLYRLRKSPPIRDQTGNVQFTEETYKVLGEKVGLANGNFALGPTALQAISLPDEPSVDVLLKALISSLQENNIEQFKQVINANNFFIHVDGDHLAFYFLALHRKSQTGVQLTFNEVQTTIIAVNREMGVQQLDQLLEEEHVDLQKLATVILGLDIGNGRVLEAYLEVYLNEFRQLKSENLLDFNHVEEIVKIVNAAADLREATLGKSPSRILEALLDQNLKLGVTVTADCSQAYADTLIHYYQKKDSHLLYGERLNQAIYQSNQFHFKLAIYNHDDNYITQLFRQTSADYVDENQQFYLSHIYDIDSDDEDGIYDVFANVPNVVEYVNQLVEEEKQLALKMFSLNESLLSNNRKDYSDLIQDISARLDYSFDSADITLNVYKLLDEELLRKCEGRKQKKLTCMKHEFPLGELRVEHSDENGNELVRVVSVQKSTGNAQPWTVNVSDFQKCVERAKRLALDDSVYMDTPVTLALKTLDDSEVTYDLMNADVPKLGSFRKLIEVLEKTSHIYDEEILLEDLKVQARKVIEQNMNMDRELRETEENIGLLLKNFRSLNLSTDPKSVKKPKINVVEAHDKAKERSEERKFFDALSNLLYYLRVNSGRMAHLMKAIITKKVFKEVFIHFGQLYNYGHTPIEELSMMMFFGHLLVYHIRSRKENFSFDPAFFSYTDLFDEAIWFAECLRIHNSQSLTGILQKLAQTPLSRDVSAGILAMKTIAARGPSVVDDAVKERLEDASNFLMECVNNIADVFVNEVQLPTALDFLIGELDAELNANHPDRTRTVYHARSLIYEFGLAPYLRQQRLTSELIGADIKLDQNHHDFFLLIEQILSSAIFGKEVGLPGFTFHQPALDKIAQSIEEIATTHLSKIKDKPPVLLYGLGHFAQLLELPSTTIKLKRSSIPIISDLLTLHAFDFEPDKDSHLLFLFDDLLNVPSKETISQLPEVIDLPLRAVAEARLHDDRLTGDVILETKLMIVCLLRLGLIGATVKELLENADFIGVNESEITEAQEYLTKLHFNLEMLTKQGIISSADNFSDLLRMMGQDIRNDRERRESRLIEIRDLKNVLSYSERTKQDIVQQTELFKLYEERCKKSIVGGLPSISEEEDNRKVKKFIKAKEKAAHKKEAITLNADKLIRKKLLFLDDPTTPKQVSKYSVKIAPGIELGTYNVECYHQGKLQKTKTVDFEKLLRMEDEAEVRLPFHGPLVFNCPELRQFLDLKFHYKIFS